MAWRLLIRLAAYNDVALSVVLCNQGRLYDNLISLNVRTNVLDENKLSALGLFAQLLRYIYHEKPDVLHCHRYKENIYGYLAGKLARVPTLISTQHGMPESFHGIAHMKSILYSKCNFFVQKHFNAVVAVSLDIEKTLTTAYRFPPNIVSTIRNGVPLTVNLVTNKHHEHFVIGSAGRFTPVKDYDLMLKTAAHIFQEEPSSRFILAGDGPLREKIIKSLNSFRFSKCFILAGSIEDMESFYLGLDVYINTSLHEGIPMTVLEAMSYGLPVVACNVGGIKEIIEDGVSGFLVSSRDPRQLAEKCLLLKRDRNLWISMSIAARRRIEAAFTDTHMANQYHVLYKRMVARQIYNDIAHG